jgi:hypothetical protein
MPNRILREGIVSSELVDSVAGEPAVEVTYRRLISLVDDFGRYTANPALVRSGAYPLRTDMYSAQQISEHLKKCEAAGLIRLYEADGKPFLEVLRFAIGQRLRAKRSKWPAPPGVVDGPADGEQSGGTWPSNVSRPLSESDSGIERRETGARGERRDNDSLATPVQPDRISPALTELDALMVKQAITEYMAEEPDDNLVLQVLEAGGGASAADICAHLKALWLKGCKAGRAKGPRGFGWFAAVTRQHFADIRGMEEARLNPTSAAHWSDIDVPEAFDPSEDL